MTSIYTTQNLLKQLQELSRGNEKYREFNVRIINDKTEPANNA
jgi:hypothetical protein